MNYKGGRRKEEILLEKDGKVINLNILRILKGFIEKGIWWHATRRGDERGSGDCYVTIYRRGRDFAARQRAAGGPAPRIQEYKDLLGNIVQHLKGPCGMITQIEPVTSEDETELRRILSEFKSSLNFFEINKIMLKILEF